MKKETTDPIASAIKLITDKRDENLATIERLRAENDAINESLLPQPSFRTGSGCSFNMRAYDDSGKEVVSLIYFRELGDKFLAAAKYNGLLWSEYQLDTLDRYIASGGKDLKRVAAQLGRTPFACFMKAARLPRTLCEGTVYELWASVFKS